MFTWDGAFVLHLKMVHTPLKVPDDCARMFMHGFSFFKDKTSKFCIIKRIFKRGKVQTNIGRMPRSVVCWVVPLEKERCEYFSIIYYIF